MSHLRQKTWTVAWTLGLVCVATPARAQDSVDAPEAPPPTTQAPTFTPPLPGNGPPPFAGQAPYPSAVAVEASFQPDEPDLQLLSLSGEMPYQEVAVARRGWWRPRGYFVGYGMAPVYAPLCDGPCHLRLMRGQYHWALAKEGGPIIPAEGGGLIAGPSTLHAQYVNRSGIRTAGAVIGIVGTIGGIVMMFESVHDKDVCDDFGYCYRHEDVNGALLAGGIGVFIGSAIASSIMLFQRDEARISVTPLQLRTVGRARDSGFVATSARANPQGAALTVSF